MYLSPIGAAALGDYGQLCPSKGLARHVALASAGAPEVLVADAWSSGFADDYQRLIPGATLTVVDLGSQDGGGLRSSTSAAPFDLVVLIGVLERSFEPQRVLSDVSNALAEGGKLVSVSSNVSSSTFRRFGGRHWAGYAIPGQSRAFGPSALAWLLQHAGFTDTDIRTYADPQYWLSSLRNLADDVDSLRWLLRVTDTRVALWVARLAERFATSRGRGSVLFASAGWHQ